MRRYYQKTKPYLRSILLMTLCVVFVFTEQARAFDAMYFSRNTIQFYDDRDCGDGGGSGSTTLNGSDNLEKIFNFFLSKGLTREQAAGAVGNISAESGGNPLAVEMLKGSGLPIESRDPASLPVVSGWPNNQTRQPGWGIIQWTPSGKVVGLAESAGITGDISTLEAQLELVWWHMTNTTPLGYTNFIEEYKQTNDLQTAASLYMEKMEGPKDKNPIDRMQQGKIVMDRVGGTSSSSTDTSSSTPSCTCASPGSQNTIGESQSPGKYDVGAVSGFVQSVADTLGKKFNIQTIGGRGGTQDHATGAALDFMVSDNAGGDFDIMKQRGDPLLDYIMANKDALKVKYVIWRQQIYFPDSGGQTAGTGRPMPDRGSPTQNHMDHVHLSMTDEALNTSSPVSGLTDGGDSAAGLGCPTVGSANGSTIVQIAQAELAKDVSGCDENVQKYTNGSCVAWCAYFVSWVYAEAGSPFPETMGFVPTMLTWFKENATYIPVGSGEAQPGDVVFYGPESNSSHVGIVVKQEGDQLESIEGNYSNRVSLVNQSISGSNIIGFGRM